jgi:ABC-type multidrug transport system fused ATPase/permease subunit
MLKKYDEIIVMNQGTVEEKGTFDELMDKKGYFYSLYTVTNTEK